MLNFIKNTWASIFTRRTISQRPGETYIDYPIDEIHSPHDALRIPSFWHALTKYQADAGLLEFPVYYEGEDGALEELFDDPVYHLLNCRPNPAMSRAQFFELLMRDYWLEGECFASLRWANNHKLLGLYPIPAGEVEIQLDEDWNKTYIHHSLGGDIQYTDAEMIHITHFSVDGIRGIPFVTWYAKDVLNLCIQVQASANGYYRNAVKPSGYLYSATAPKDEAAREAVKKDFNKKYAGPNNTGEVPYLYGCEFKPFSNTNAADAQIQEALHSEILRVAPLFRMTPLQLGDLTKGTYNNLSAENTAWIQRGMMPILNKFELEVNYKLFADRRTFAKFDIRGLLRGDPAIDAAVDNQGILNGSLLINEVRKAQGLRAIPGGSIPKSMANIQPQVTATPVEGANDTAIVSPTTGTA